MTRITTLKKISIYFLLTLNGFNIQAQDSTYWWNDDVFYEIFVRSFKDSDGDGIGDIRGLINNLDYLNDGDSTTHNDLGITAIWLMPIQQSPSYHGYDVIDYKEVESDYGTNADFQELMDEAHSRGIKIIMDYVMNHTSSEHPWFINSVLDNGKRDWYIWEETDPGFNGPWGQDVWHYIIGDYYYGLFWSGMPDLNYTTPEVKSEMFDIAEFWLDTMGVDRFRLDAIKYIYEDGNNLQDLPETYQFWKDFRTHYKSINPDAMAVGEAWTSTAVVKNYVEGDGLDFCFDFDLASDMIQAVNAGTPVILKQQVNTVLSSYPHLQFGTFLTNHDMDRVMNQLGQSTTKAKLAANLLFTLPGVPYVYYGEEIGMTGTKPDEYIRTPLHWNNDYAAGFTTGSPWWTINADYTTKNIEGQQYDNNSLWHHYRNLISIRNEQVALRRGDYTELTTSSASTYGFLRQYLDESVIVVHQTGTSTLLNENVTIDQSQFASGDYTLVELQGGEAIPLTIDSTGGDLDITINELTTRSTHIYKLIPSTDLSTTITFQVDMRAMIDSGDFNPATETVDIVATFNTFGTDSITELLDLDGDSIYSVTIETNIGSLNEYKYRINGVNDGREEFLNSSYYRSYVTQEGVNSVLDIYESLDQSLVSSTGNGFLEATLDLYPNPVVDDIEVYIGGGFSGEIEYSITDMLGCDRQSSVVDCTGGYLSIDCGNLNAGNYLLNLVHEGVKRVFRASIQ